MVRGGVGGGPRGVGGWRGGRRRPGGAPPVHDLLFLTERTTRTVSPTVPTSGSGVPTDAADTETVKSWFWPPVPVVASAPDASPRANTVAAVRIITRLESMSFLIQALLGDESLGKGHTRGSPISRRRPRRGEEKSGNSLKIEGGKPAPDPEGPTPFTALARAGTCPPSGRDSRGDRAGGPRWELEGFGDRARASLGDEPRDVQPRLDREDFVLGHPRRRVCRHEERATVGVRLDRDLEGPEALRLLGDLDLVHADEGSKDRHPGGLVDARDVLERLRGDLPEALPRRERLGPALAGERLRDPDHEPAVDDHARGRRDREDDLALDLPEWDHDQTRLVLPRGEPLDERPRLRLRRRRQVRHAVEVHESDAAAAFHHPPRGHRRDHPAREQRRDRPRPAHGPAARARPR